ncbi:MAG: histidinol dehydrogenase [Syntrophales bacterium]|nr:histidinol dehydrogenase [Syntrophales bacterium]
MRVIHTGDLNFEETLRRLRQRGKVFDDDVWTVVSRIVTDVAVRGDQAIFEYTEKFDGQTINAGTVMVSSGERENAIRQADKEDLEALKLAADRIEKFHQKQIIQGCLSSDEEGVELGLQISPLERVGIYVPGGLACYPSTVLMAAIPAMIAGVEEIFLVTPPRGKRINPLLAAAAKIGGVKQIFRVGGAQAIAALAYGTESIPAVDKIVGPGNAYVAAAKKMVYGQVAIDMIAGPSEIVVISDGTADASLVAADLLAQAEHDKMASAVLLTPDEELAWRVASEVKIQLDDLPRKDIAENSLQEFGAIIVTESIDEAVAIANRFAPEHLELMVENPRKILGRIRNAGAVFLGYWAPEAIGDYIAGTNHILPTGGTARFSSPLGVHDFVKRTSVISFSREALHRYGKEAVRLAKLEGLDGHGRSIAMRMARKKLDKM